MRRSVSCKVLMVYPRFHAHSFWNYQATCEVVGARYSASPLGLITVAALLPATWDVRLINRNTEALTAEDLEWADLVMTGGMLPQQHDTLLVVQEAHAYGKPVVVGGPDATASPHVYDEAEFIVLGEAEEIMSAFLDAWASGQVRGRFTAEGFPDITRSPLPRFDLLKFDHFMHVGVQLTRGCPFHCEFCNVIELNGRVPRVKTTEQMFRELETLYALGYRGHVDFVDDNLIGNRKVVKPFLAELAVWLEKHGYPFEFTTEASLNIADDEELLRLMERAGFFAVFVGIETPDSATLISTQKHQNTRRNIAESIHRIYEHGIFVNAGFIIGFDAETGTVAEAMVACIEEAAIPVAMVGLLYALPNTQLSRRLIVEGRLHAESDRQGADFADQCTSGLNYATLRPREETLEDYRSVLKSIYDPEAFFGRTRRLGRALDVSKHKIRRTRRGLLRDVRSFARIGWRSGVHDARVRGPFWRALLDCALHNPRALRIVVSQAALFLHLRPFSQILDVRLRSRIEVERRLESPAALPSAVAS